MLNKDANCSLANIDIENCNNWRSSGFMLLKKAVELLMNSVVLHVNDQ